MAIGTIKGYLSVGRSLYSYKENRYLLRLAYYESNYYPLYFYTAYSERVSRVYIK
jgi:hypothetical protein